VKSNHIGKRTFLPLDALLAMHNLLARPAIPPIQLRQKRGENITNTLSNSNLPSNIAII
jgi:hypothetical protein